MSDKIEPVTEEENGTLAAVIKRALGYRRMSQNMAVRSWSTDAYFTHASGRCTCSQCGMEYADHPEKDGLFLVCDGRLYKL